MAARPAERVRVLLVEDDDDTRELLEEALAVDFDVRAAPDAARALTQFPDGGPDVLVTDESLPGGMRGVALARELKTRHPGARVIIVSGHAQIAGADSADLLLRKPLELPQLLEAIASLASGR